MLPLPLTPALTPPLLLLVVLVLAAAAAAVAAAPADTALVTAIFCFLYCSRCFCCFRRFRLRFCCCLRFFCCLRFCCCYSLLPTQATGLRNRAPHPPPPPPKHTRQATTPTTLPSNLNQRTHRACTHVHTHMHTHTNTLSHTFTHANTLSRTHTHVNTLATQTDLRQPTVRQHSSEHRLPLRPVLPVRVCVCARLRVCISGGAEGAGGESEVP